MEWCGGWKGEIDIGISSLTKIIKIQYVNIMYVVRWSSVASSGELMLYGTV